MYIVYFTKTQRCKNYNINTKHSELLPLYKSLCEPILCYLHLQKKKENTLATQTGLEEEAGFPFMDAFTPLLSKLRLLGLFCR